MNCERLLTPGPNTAALPVSLSLSSIVPRAPGMSQPALKAKPFRVYETRLQFWNWSVILLCALSFVTSHASPSLLKCHVLTLLLCMNFHILLLFNNASKIFKVPSKPLTFYDSMVRKQGDDLGMRTLGFHSYLGRAAGLCPGSSEARQLGLLLLHIERWTGPQTRSPLNLSGEYA